MSAPKLLNTWGVLMNVEPSYLGAVTLAAGADGILVTERPEVTIDHAHQGERRGTNPGTPGAFRRVARSGRFGEVDIVQQFSGFGAAYSASNTPSIHRMARIGGLTAVGAFSAGTESWTYTPTAEGAYASGAIEAYLRGQLFRLTGAYSDLAIEGEAGDIPNWTFATRGVAAAPTDVALPAITYNAPFSVDPAKWAEPGSSNFMATINGWNAARVQSFSFNFTRGIQARRLDNSTGLHGGFSLGARAATLNIVVEAGPFSGFNPYALADASTPFAVTLRCGGVQYRRWRLTASNAQLLHDPEAEDDAVGMWNLQMELKPSAFTANDEFSIIAD